MDIESVRTAIAQADAFVFRFINGSLAWKPLDGPMLLITSVGTGVFQSGVSIILVLWGALRSKTDVMKAGCAGLIAFAFSGVVVQIAKHACDRPRPVLALYDVRVVGDPLFVHSFPSGHTVTAFALMVALSMVLPRLRWFLWSLAALAGFSRIYLGLHFPLDVICGAVIGAVVGVLSARLVTGSPAGPKHHSGSINRPSPELPL